MLPAEGVVPRTVRWVDLLLPESRPVSGTGLLDLYDAPGPYLRAGMVTSLDGASARDGASRALQPPGDAAVFAALRAVADAVVVGAGTARTEGYRPVALRAVARAWRAQHERRPGVPLVVVSRRLDIPADAPWLAAGDPLIVTCAASPAARRAQLAERAEILVCGDDAVDLAVAAGRLAERGLVRLLCEGGPSLLGDLVRARLLTEVCATVAPVLAGGGSGGMVSGTLPALVPLDLVSLLREGSTLLGRWRVGPG